MIPDFLTQMERAPHVYVGALTGAECGSKRIETDRLAGLGEAQLLADSGSAFKRLATHLNLVQLHDPAVDGDERDRLTVERDRNQQSGPQAAQILAVLATNAAVREVVATLDLEPHAFVGLELLAVDILRQSVENLGSHCIFLRLLQMGTRPVSYNNHKRSQYFRAYTLATKDIPTCLLEYLTVGYDDEEYLVFSSSRFQSLYNGSY